MHLHQVMREIKIDTNITAKKRRGKIFPPKKASEKSSHPLRA